MLPLINVNASIIDLLTLDELKDPTIASRYSQLYTPNQKCVDVSMCVFDTWLQQFISQIKFDTIDTNISTLAICTDYDCQRVASDSEDDQDGYDKHSRNFRSITSTLPLSGTKSTRSASKFKKFFRRISKTHKRKCKRYGFMERISKCSQKQQQKQQEQQFTQQQQQQQRNHHQEPHCVQLYRKLTRQLDAVFLNSLYPADAASRFTIKQDVLLPFISSNLKLEFDSSSSVSMESLCLCQRVSLISPVYYHLPISPLHSKFNTFVAQSQPQLSPQLSPQLLPQLLLPLPLPQLPPSYRVDYIESIEDGDVFTTLILNDAITGVETTF